MSEDTEKPEEQVDAEVEAEAEAERPRCGELLAEARREQQISVSEVAKELHLDELKVRALERNEFELLGAPVFAKGHLRKYSQLVGVDEDDVFTDYYTMTRADGMPPIVSKRKKIRQEMSPGPWIAVIVLIIVAAAAYWWFVIRIENAVVLPAQPAETVPEQTEAAAPEPVELEPDAATTDDADEEAETVAESTPEVAPTPEPVVEKPMPADQINVSLSFSGECWTEISDADGQQLFFSMGRAGETVDLSGRAPLSALFGNADNVDVTVNGSSYTLPAPNSANRTVRVAILNQ